MKTIFATDLINELGRSLNYKPPRRFKSWINDSNPHRSLILNRGFKIWISYRQFSDQAQIRLFRTPAEGKINFYDEKWSPWFKYIFSSFAGCPNKHVNSVTNSTSSLLWISIAIHGIISHNIIMSARVYFMKTVNGCNVSIMFLQDEQWRRTSLLCLYTVIFLFY